MAPSLVYESVTGEYGRMLNEDFVNPFRSGYISLDGHILPEYFKEFGTSIKDMKIRKDDVWICSFPKCGTTWSQEMVWLIGNDLDYEGAKMPIQERFPFLEHTPLFDYRDFWKKYPDFSVPAHVTDSIGFINDMKCPRYIKTHLPFNTLPEEICNKTALPKIIYTSRNPKDCLISYYHHCRLMEGYKGNFDNFFKLFLNGKLCFAPFWPHIMEFWKRRNEKNVLFLQYEEMKADLPSVIRKVAAFLDKEYTDDQIAKLADHLSFDNMKKNPAVNYEPITDMNKKLGLITIEGSFMRSGKVGDFKAHMTPEQISQIDTWIEENTKGTDFDFSHY